MVMVVRQCIAVVLMLAGIWSGATGLADQNLTRDELYLALGLTLAGGLVFDSDTFIRVIKAWRDPSGDA